MSRAPQPDNANRLQSIFTNAKRSAAARAKSLGLRVVSSPAKGEALRRDLDRCAPVLNARDLGRQGSLLRAFNVERVRGYLERNLGCSQKEVALALELDRRTVARAVRTIRGRL